VATVLGGLLLAPVRDFLAGAWRLATAAPGAIWSGFTATVPLWALLAVVAVVALAARWVGRRAPPAAPRIEVYDTATRTYGPPPVEDPGPAAPPRLTELEDGILRRLARADGEWLAIDELGTACR